MFPRAKDGTIDSGFLQDIQLGCAWGTLSLDDIRMVLETALKVLDTPGSFDRFVAAWPKGFRSGKDAARREWERRGLGSMEADILAAVSRLKQSRQWRNGFIPKMVKWLRDGGWQDDLELSTEAKIAETTRRITEKHMERKREEAEVVPLTPEQKRAIRERVQAAQRAQGIAVRDVRRSGELPCPPPDRRCGDGPEDF